MVAGINVDIHGATTGEYPLVPRESGCQYRVAESAFHATDRRDVHAAQHLSSAGLGRAHDALGRDFAEQVAAPKQVAIMASTEDHCLLDLLWRNRRGG